MRERARAVETAMVDVIALCQNCVGEVFRPGHEETEKGDHGGGEDSGKLVGGEGVLWDSIAGERRKDVPAVKDFEKLSLLGH